MESLEMRHQQPRHRARPAIIAAAMMSLSMSAFGQTGQLLKTASTAQATSAEPAGPVRQLTAEQAVRLALEQNLGIQIERVNPQIQDVSVAQARSFWAPQLTSSLSRNSINTFNTSSLAGTQSTVTSGLFSGGTGVNQLLPTGGNYSVFWSNSRSTTSDVSSIVNPKLLSALQFNVTQPLLRNFVIDNVRQTLALSHKSRDASDVQLHARIVQTTEAVKNAYWDLVYQIDNLKAAQQALEVAQQSLRDNTRRVEIGTMAPIDIVDAKAEVARNEEAVIVAGTQIEQAQDTLKTLIFDPGTSDFWKVRIDPTDTAPFQVQAIDTDAAVRNALDKRTDLIIAKNNIAQSDISIRYFRNQILPDINAQAQYITTGTAGVLLDHNLGAVLGQRGYSSALADVFQNNYPAWTFGVQVGYPLGTSTAKANLERAKLQYQQSMTQLKNLEMQIAAQVRGVARQVAANQKRVESATASRMLAEEKLAAEEKKFAAGIRETFFVIQAQRDLAAARTLEVKAIGDYNKSLVDFDAVQEVAVGGPTSGVTTAGAGAIQPGSNAGAIIR
jgi:outer membrane protein